jgi:predicted DsbA family dithiol-disulfide isomerase
MTMRTIALELYADVVCPWCWIGDRRLFRALETVRPAHPDVRFDVSWRPFQLDPTVPAGGRPWAEVIEHKFGGAERANAMFGHVAAAGAGDGITFAFDRITTAPNTVQAHGVVLMAQQQGLEPWPLVEALFAAYFEEGADVGDTETLVRLAAMHGLDEEAVRTALTEGRHDMDVQQSQREASRLGVQGVPFLVLDGRFAVSGAQPQPLFEQALARVIER